MSTWAVSVPSPTCMTPSGTRKKQSARSQRLSPPWEPSVCSCCQVSEALDGGTILAETAARALVRREPVQPRSSVRHRLDRWRQPYVPQSLPAHGYGTQVGHERDATDRLGQQAVPQDRGRTHEGRLLCRQQEIVEELTRKDWRDAQVPGSGTATDPTPAAGCAIPAERSLTGRRVSGGMGHDEEILL